jgi:hypothetical protein
MYSVSITLPESIVTKIDSERKDISRSRYITRLLERAYVNLQNGEVQNQ